MQTGVRKNSSERGHCKIRRTKTNIKAIACLSLIFTFGCATFQKPDQKSLKFNLDRICFSADGKGRVGLSSKKFSFDFETLIERDKKKWSIDFHFPGGIEKIIEVDYLKSIKQQKESFKNLLKDLTKEEFNEFLLGEFWEKMSKILKESEAPYPNLNWSISKDRFIINFPQNKGHFFRLEASELNIYYQHLKVFIEREREIMGSPLELELFLNNCSAI